MVAANVEIIADITASLHAMTTLNAGGTNQPTHALPKTQIAQDLLRLASLP
jgi:hypothetical protein